MDPTDNTPVVDDGAGSPPADNVTPDSTPQDGGVTPDIEGWKAENKVPYSRFEEVVRANQEFRSDFSKRLDEITELLNNSKQPTPDTTGQESEWDQMAKSSKNWGEFISNLTPKLYSEFKRIETDEKTKAEQSLNQEIQSLYSTGLVKTKDEENAVLQFAVKKSEELKQSVPLAVAARWYQETNKAPDNKAGAGKALPPSRSAGGPGKPGFSYKDIRSKGLDEIVMEAKENAPKG